MAARTKTNKDEVLRRLPLTPAPLKHTPSTPLATGSKSKFKPTRSIATSTPATTHVTVRKPPPASTPAFEPLPTSVASTLAADKSLSIVSISSTDSTALDISTSSIPAKRLSFGPPEDIASRSSPKRPKTTHAPDKENHFRPDPPGKGKARAREARPHPGSTSSGAAKLRASFESLTCDADLEEVRNVPIFCSLSPHDSATHVYPRNPKKTSVES
ncbi:hypothetical protein C8Q77DRAFT_559783 [Trametes polyzona]|nr:hypothetical protein C8Q77DRAFT_559783 [Trametes polyzona]